MSWDTAFESNKSGASVKAEFTRFPEGITRIRFVNTNLHTRWTHWMPASTLKGVTGKGRSVNCPGKGCPICELRKQAKMNKETPKYSMQQRFAANVINRETKRAEILEQGKNFFEEIREIRKEGLNPTDKDESPRGELTEYDLKIKRRGTGQDDTTYRIDPDKVYPISEEDIKLIESATNLDEYFKTHTIEQIVRLLNGEIWEDVMKSEQEQQTQEEEVGIE